MTTQSIQSKFDMLPDDLKKEVQDFIEFLLEKKSRENQEVKGKRSLGLAKGLIKMKPGFDDPIEDFKEYM